MIPNNSTQPKPKPAAAPASPSTTTTASSPSSTASAVAPQPSRQDQLSAIRSAAAKATLAGPSKEAQALMSDRTKTILGNQRLQAGAQAQQQVSSMPAPTQTTRQLSPINPEWAKANPKLAAAEMERRRTRGTAQSDNPLLGDLRSRMPMNSPSVQASNVSSLGKGFQSLTQNPNAIKAAPAKPTPTPAPTQQQTQTKPPAPTQTLTAQQQSLYKQAYANRNNPLAKGRIQAELNKMTPEQRKIFQQYAQSQGQDKDWAGYTFEQFINTQKAQGSMNHTQAIAEAYSSMYASQELTEEVQIVAEYFCNLGLNEDGIDILIEELGTEEFVEFVNDILEEFNLSEARAGGERIEPVTATGKKFKSGKPTGKSLERLRAKKAARREAEEKASEAKPSGLKASLQRQSAVASAKKQQPKKRGLLDRVAGAVLKGIDRHNAAMGELKKMGDATKETAGKVRKAAGEFKKGLTSEEVILNHLISEGYADTPQSAIKILNAMSESWAQSIIEKNNHP